MFGRPSYDRLFAAMILAWTVSGRAVLAADADGLTGEQFAKIKQRVREYQQYTAEITKEMVAVHTARQGSAKYADLAREWGGLCETLALETGRNPPIIAAECKKAFKISPPPGFSVGTFTGMPYAFSGNDTQALKKETNRSLGVHELAYVFKLVLGSTGKIQEKGILQSIRNQAEFFGIDCSAFVSDLLSLPRGTTTDALRSPAPKDGTTVEAPGGSFRIEVADLKSFLNCTLRQGTASTPPTLCRTEIEPQDGIVKFLKLLKAGDLITIAGHVAMVYQEQAKAQVLVLAESTSGKDVSGVQLSYLGANDQSAITREIEVDGSLEKLFRTGLTFPPKKYPVMILRPMTGYAWGPRSPKAVAPKNIHQAYSGPARVKRLLRAFVPPDLVLTPRSLVLEEPPVLRAFPEITRDIPVYLSFGPHPPAPPGPRQTPLPPTPSTQAAIAVGIIKSDLLIQKTAALETVSIGKNSFKVAGLRSLVRKDHVARDLKFAVLPLRFLHDKTPGSLWPLTYQSDDAVTVRPCATILIGRRWRHFKFLRLPLFEPTYSLRELSSGCKGVQR